MVVVSYSQPRYVLRLAEVDLQKVGEKARNLKYLSDAGYQIPETLVCDYDVYLEYVRGNSEILTLVEHDLPRLSTEKSVFLDIPFHGRKNHAKPFFTSMT